MRDKKAEKQLIVEFNDVVLRLCGMWSAKIIVIVQKRGEQYYVLIKKFRKNYPNAEKQEVVKNSLRKTSGDS